MQKSKSQSGMHGTYKKIRGSVVCVVGGSKESTSTEHHRGNARLDHRATVSALSDMRSH